MRAKLRALLRPGGAQLEAQADAAFARQDFATALALTRRLAERGNVAAFYRLGEMFEFGLGMLQDFAQALHWYERAADAGAVDAWAKLGDFHLVGRGHRADEGQGGDRLLGLLSVRPDFEKAAYWNRRAAEAGIAGAQARLGFQHVQGLGVERDMGEAEQLLRAAAEAGDVPAQRWLGMLHAGNEAGAPRVEEAARWFRAAARARDVTSCVGLATLILDGAIAEGGDDEAFGLLSAAAEAGHVGAMTLIGGLCRDGRGTRRDLGAAESWFRRAAARGSRDGALLLGLLLTDVAEPPDPVSGAVAFREAAERGDPVAQYRLGTQYLSGLGVAADDTKGFRWIEAAAGQNLLPAIEALAALHADGRGVEENPRVAAALFERAAGLGSVDAPYHRAMLALSGQSGESDAGDILALLNEAAARGSVAACLQLGAMHAQGQRVERDYGCAARWYGRAVELGSSDGLFNLAFLRLRALDPAPVDARSGAALLEEAAALGNRAASWALYNIHRDGVYVERNPEAADLWLIEAARRGVGGAAALLAERLDDPGSAEGASPADMVGWLRAAAEQGESDAQVRLALMLREGRHVPSDRDAAFRLMHAAAVAGHPFAQAWLGDVLASGDGVTKDEALARHWYGQAAAQGHPGARMMLETMAVSPP